MRGSLLKIALFAIPFLLLFLFFTPLKASADTDRSPDYKTEVERNSADFKCDNRDHAHIKEPKSRALGPKDGGYIYFWLCRDASDASAEESPLGSIQQPDALKSFGVGEAGIARFISVIIGILVVTAVILGFIFLIIGGISFITAGGDEAKVESARSKVIWAIIGLAIVFAAFAIITIVESIFGVSIIGEDFDIPGV